MGQSPGLLVAPLAAPGSASRPASLRIARQLIGRCAVPLALVPTPTPPAATGGESGTTTAPSQPILVAGVRSPEFCWSLVCAAASTAHRLGAQLELVHAVPAPVLDSGGSRPPMSLSRRAFWAAWPIEAAIGKWRAETGLCVRITPRVIVGDPAEVLLTAAVGAERVIVEAPAGDHTAAGGPPSTTDVLLSGTSVPLIVLPSRR